MIFSNGLELKGCGRTCVEVFLAFTISENSGIELKCPRCGNEVQPIKTWHLTSPLPDAEGRISITIMGSFRCPRCGHSWRGKVSVLKVGGEHDINIGGSRARLPAKRREEGRKEGKVIEIDVSEVISLEEE